MVCGRCGLTAEQIYAISRATVPHPPPGWSPPCVLRNMEMYEADHEYLEQIADYFKTLHAASLEALATTACCCGAAKVGTTHATWCTKFVLQ